MPFLTFLRLQGDHHCACAQKWCHFSFFSRAFKQKKIRALRPKMTKIASRGVLPKSGSVTIFSEFLRFFFCASKKWLLIAQVSRISARSAARTASPPQLSRANVVFLEQLSFSAALPCGRHYFSPHKMAAKNHRLS